jgi:hypothetical protein
MGVRYWKAEEAKMKVPVETLSVRLQAALFLYLSICASAAAGQQTTHINVPGVDPRFSTECSVYQLSGYFWQWKDDHRPVYSS